MGITGITNNLIQIATISILHDYIDIALSFKKGIKFNNIGMI
jgi:hypothetical protein